VVVCEILLSSDAVNLGDVTVSTSMAIHRKALVTLSTMESMVLETKLSNQKFPEVLKSTPVLFIELRLFLYLRGANLLS